jgi:hypothetical protein
MNPQFTFNSLKGWNFYFTPNYDEWGRVNLTDGPETISHSKVFLSAEVQKRRHTQDQQKAAFWKNEKILFPSIGSPVRILQIYERQPCLILVYNYYNS